MFLALFGGFICAVPKHKCLLSLSLEMVHQPELKDDQAI